MYALEQYDYSDQNKDNSQIIFQNADDLLQKQERSKYVPQKNLVSFAQATNFKPQAFDVTMAKYLLIAQFTDFILKLLIESFLSPFVIVLQAMFTIPLMSLSIYLYARFKYNYSRGSMKNMIIISGLMLIENSSNTILRFFVSLKVLLNNPSHMHKIVILWSVTIPWIFATIWFFILVEAIQKNGHYGAPLSLMNKYENELKKNGQESDFISQILQMIGFGPNQDDMNLSTEGISEDDNSAVLSIPEDAAQDQDYEQPISDIQLKNEFTPHTTDSGAETAVSNNLFAKFQQIINFGNSKNNYDRLDQHSDRSGEDDLDFYDNEIEQTPLFKDELSIINGGHQAPRFSCPADQRLTLAQKLGHHRERDCVAPSTTNRDSDVVSSFSIPSSSTDNVSLRLIGKSSIPNYRIQRQEPTNIQMAHLKNN